jgi:hypothetical protein
LVVVVVMEFYIFNTLREISEFIHFFQSLVANSTFLIVIWLHVYACHLYGYEKQRTEIRVLYF